MSNNELDRKALAEALEHANVKFKLHYSQGSFLHRDTNYLLFIMDTMADFVNPKDRDAFFAFIDGFQCGFKRNDRRNEQ